MMVTFTDVEKISNNLNYHKFCKILAEPCTRTFLYVFEKFYDWSDKWPNKLADHLDDIPKNQSKPLKKLLNKADIKKIKDMNTNKDLLKSYDITFYYKIVQYGTNSDKIAHPDDSVWYDDKQNSNNEMEHLLFLLKESRNIISHKGKSILKLTNRNIDDFCLDLFQKISSIIRDVGRRVGIAEAESDLVCTELVDQIKTIRDQSDIFTFDRDNILNCAKKDLQKSLKELKRSFEEKELKSYCPPILLLKSGNSDKEISIKDLLLSDDQVTIIVGEAGYGKTSFTKYLLYLWLMENTNVIERLSSFAFVFRVICQKIHSRDVTLFVEGELPNTIELMQTSSSLMKLLKDYKILWVIDGNDEATTEFHGFFNSLLSTISSNHRIIITTRPDCLEDIVAQVEYKKMSTLSIKTFVEQQIMTVAGKYLDDDANELQKFVSYYQTLRDDSKNILKTPINLNLYLELWIIDADLLNEELNAYKLFQKIFEKNLIRLINRLHGRMGASNKACVERRVNKWFYGLCKSAVMSHFDGIHNLSITKLIEEELIESALCWKLIETDCLSTFFDSKITSTGHEYCFRHNIQVEVLVSLYLKRCDENMLISLAKEDYVHTYLKKRNSIEMFDFLFKCCDSAEYSRIYSIFLKEHLTLQCADYLLQIKTKNEAYFVDLKKTIGFWDEPLMISLYTDVDVESLKNIIESLSSDVKRIKLKIGIQYDSQKDDYRIINNILHEYKEISFQVILLLAEGYKLIPVIQILKEQSQLIQEIHFHSDWEENTIKELSSLKNLIKMSFHVNAHSSSKFPKSFLAHLASLGSTNSKSIPSHFSYSFFKSTNHTPLASPLPWSFRILQKTCHVHFNIVCRFYKPTEVIRDLLEVNRKFLFVSICLNLWFRRIDVANSWLGKRLLSKLQSSTIQVKELKMNLGSLHKYSFWLELVNCPNIEKLDLKLYYSRREIDGNLIDEPTPLLTLKSLLKIWKYDKISKLEVIIFEIMTSDQLKILYKELPSNIIAKTIVKVKQVSKRSWNDWMATNISQFSGKTFLKLEILRHPSHPLCFLDSEVIQSLTLIFKTVVIDDIANLSNESTECLNYIQIKHIVLDYLEEPDDQNFLSFYGNLKEDLKLFMQKTRRNLILCIQTWQVDPSLLNRNLTTGNLFESLFETQNYIVVEKLEGKSNFRDKDKWMEKLFCELCRIAAELVFKYSEFSDFSKSNENDILNLASNYGLSGSDFLQIFLDFKNTSTGIEYSFREYQKEALACLYLQRCTDEELWKISEDCNVNYLDRKDLLNYFYFLYQFFDSVQFVRIIAIFIKSQRRPLRVDLLMKLETRDKDCFYALKKQISLWNRPLKLYLYDGIDVRALQSIIQSLSTDFQAIDLVLKIQYDVVKDNYTIVNTILSEYKDIAFQLTLKVDKEFKVNSVIRMFKDRQNQKLIKEIIVVNSAWEDEDIKELLSLNNLIKANIYIEASNEEDYSKSFFVQLLSSNLANLVSIPFPPNSESFNCASLDSPSSSSINIFHQFCHAHFIVEFGFRNPSEVLQDLLNVCEHIHSVSVSLNISFRKTDAVTSDSDKELLLRLQSSNVHVKELKLKLGNLSEDSIWFQLVNHGNLERLELELFYGKKSNDDEVILQPTSQFTMKRFFEILKFEEQRNLKEIELKIETPDQLNLLYKELPTNLIAKTIVTVYHDPNRPKNEWISNNVVSFTGKKFKKLEIRKFNIPPPFDDVETIEKIKAITHSLNIQNKILLDISFSL